LPWDNFGEILLASSHDRKAWISKILNESIKRDAILALKEDSAQTVLEILQKVG
jgi:hypothetical protein